MIHPFKAFSITALTIAILSFSLSGSSMAQSAGMAGSSDNAAAANAAPMQQSIDDATLQHTAKAFVKVTQIIDNEKASMNNQTDEQTKKQAAAQAESDKLAAVKSEGLEPQQYNQVLQVVQNDSNLQQKFLSYVKDNRSASPDSTL